MISICKTSLLVFILLPFCVVAQMENANWYFGKFAALTFNNGTVKTLDNSAMNAFEGCATISDTAGNLLFYTNGTQVFTRKHVVMPNGTVLRGSPSSSQSAMIIRKPGSLDMYYIITVNGISGDPTWGAFYNVVDMRKNGGDGAVVQTNVPLQNTTDEKITAVKHNNGKDIWIIIPERNTAYVNSYLVTDSGISTTPVSSNTGLYTNGSIGCFRASFDCRKLAMCLYSARTYSHIVVSDYDNSTGKLSNAYSLSMSNPYAVEFSKNGRYLYASAEDRNINLNQFDLLAGTPAQVQASLYTLLDYSNTNYYVAGLQLGIDDMIYFSQVNTSYLGRIRYPDLGKNACSVQTNAINLKKGIAMYGIQNYLYTNSGKPQILFSSEVSTCNIKARFALSNYMSVKSLLWNFGDSLASTKTNISDSSSPRHNYLYGSKYMVTVIVIYSNLQTDTLSEWIKLPSLLKSNFTPYFKDHYFKCPEASLQLTCPYKNYHYRWENGDTSSSRMLTLPGTYTLAYFDSSFCSDTQTISIDDFIVGTSLGPDKKICISDSVLLEEQSKADYTSYTWSNNSSSASIYGRADNIYILSTKDKNNCLSSDTIEIIGKANPIADLGPDISFCEGDSMLILSKFQNKLDEYRWNGELVEKGKPIVETGILILKAINDQCFSYDTMLVTVDAYPMTELGKSDSICINGSYPLDAGLASTYLWNTGGNERILHINTSGTYSVKTGNGQCYSYDSIHIALKDIRLFIPNAFTPNDDAVNDVFALDPEINFIEFQVYNTWGEMIYESHDEHPAWNGQYKSAFCQTGYYLLKVVYWDCQHRRVYKSQGFYLLL